jgi:hypothetical protein
MLQLNVSKQQPSAVDNAYIVVQVTENINKNRR